MKPSEEPVVVEQSYHTSPEAIWKAITDIEEMRQWYFPNIPDFKAEVGFETEFVVDCGDRKFPHVWKVTEVVPGKKLVYDWSYRNYPGDAFVTFEILNGDGDATPTLRVTSTSREPFPDDIPEFTRESCLGGWQYFIQQNLKQYLEKQPAT